MHFIDNGFEKKPTIYILPCVNNMVVLFIMIHAWKGHLNRWDRDFNKNLHMSSEERKGKYIYS